MWKRTTSWVNAPLDLGKRSKLGVYTNKVNLINNGQANSFIDKLKCSLMQRY